MAVLDIEVTQGIDAAMPIAVVPFQGEAPLAHKVSEIIRHDLNRSGEFALLPI